MVSLADTLFDEYIGLLTVDIIGMSISPIVSLRFSGYT